MNKKRSIIQVNLNGQTFSLNQFCKFYSLSYSTAYRYYKKGLRDQALFDALIARKYSNIVIFGQKFHSLKSAAKYFKVPYSTFLRKFKDGTLNEYLQNRKLKENST